MPSKILQEHTQQLYLFNACEEQTFIISEKPVVQAPAETSHMNEIAVNLDTRARLLKRILVDLSQDAQTAGLVKKAGCVHIDQRIVKSIGSESKVRETANRRDKVASEHTKHRRAHVEEAIGAQILRESVNDIAKDMGTGITMEAQRIEQAITHEVNAFLHAFGVEHGNAKIRRQLIKRLDDRANQRHKYS